MKFLRLLMADGGGVRWRLLAAILLAGVGAGFILAIVNSIADRQSTAEIDFEALIMFVLSAILVIASQTYAFRTTAAMNETMLERRRAALVGLIRKVRLGALEQIGTDRIYDTVSRQTLVLSEAGPMIVHGFISAIALVLAALYIAAISTLAFVVVAGLFAATIFLYRASQRNIRAALRRAGEREERFFQLLGHLLRGFKEAKLHAERGADLEGKYLQPVSAEARDRRIEAERQISGGQTATYMGFYTLLGAVVFALPQYLDSTATAMKIVYVVLFILSTVEVVLKSVPMLAKADLALESLGAVEDRLRAAAGEAELAPAAAPATFREIVFDGIAFTHFGPDGKPSFTVGPCDLTLEPGKMITFVGGNGSGKSTLMRLLTGLYQPAQGTIRWDGLAVGPANAADYRKLFSAVFADFHLFDRLYGLEPADEARVNALLADLGLGGKTAYADGRFTNLELSTGQRKRLALAVALLEDKPIYVLDEIAADQDPGFRQRLYDEIFPRLKAAGKTLIVVSHDERYFARADRVLTMHDGRIEDGGAKS